MADTVRTQTDLLTNLFQDGQSAGISAQDMRDLIVSVMGAYGSMSLFDETGVAHGNSGSIGTSYELLDTFDTDGVSDNVVADSTTDSDLTINIAGDYYIDFNISFTGSASTQYFFQLYKNDAAQDIGCTAFVDANGDEEGASFCATQTFAASDVIEVWVKADGISKNLTAYSCNLAVRRLG